MTIRPIPFLGPHLSSLLTQRRAVRTGHQAITLPCNSSWWKLTILEAPFTQEGRHQTIQDLHNQRPSASSNCLRPHSKIFLYPRSKRPKTRGLLKTSIRFTQLLSLSRDRSMILMVRCISRQVLSVCSINSSIFKLKSLLLRWWTQQLAKGSIAQHQGQMGKTQRLPRSRPKRVVLTWTGQRCLDFKVCIITLLKTQESLNLSLQVVVTIILQAPLRTSSI